MAPDAHKNLAISNVATAPSPATSGTSLVVTAGHGTRFPTVPFNATIWQSGVDADPTNAEIVRVTAISTDTFTITRAQESTTARTVVVGDRIAATITAKTLTDAETGAWTVVTKTGDENVANTTLQNDDELFFTASSGSVYEIEVTLVYNSAVGAGTPDLKVAFGEDSTATRGAMTIVSGINTGDTAAQTGGARTNQSDSIGTGTGTANRVARYVGAHVGNGGTFRVLWAQNTSNANNTTVKTGSVLRYRLVV